VDEALAYRTLPESADSLGIACLRREGADMVTFTSASTAENFHALELPTDKKMSFASIGPITSKAMRTLDLPVSLEAKSHDILGLIQAIVDFYKK
jgi:uroporphyrinogen III methyltransferase/synthase